MGERIDIMYIRRDVEDYIRGASSSFQAIAIYWPSFQLAMLRKWPTFKLALPCNFQKIIKNYLFLPLYPNF